MNNNSSFHHSIRHLFNDIDISLLYGIQCSSGNKIQQNYFERLKVQTESAFINKKFQVN